MTADIRRIDDSISVAPQLGEGDFAEIAARGFTTVVNNRPDGEEPGQLTAAQGAALARQAGLDYVHVPVTTQGMGPADVQDFADALAAAKGPVLAHCRSGTRSTILWAMAAAKGGKLSPDEILRMARAAGYDLSGQRPILEGYARQAG